MRTPADRVKSDAALHSRASVDSGLRVRMRSSASGSNSGSSRRRPSPSDVSDSSQPSTGSTKYNKAPSHPASTLSQTTVDSQATSVAPERKAPSRPPPVSVADDHSPPSHPDSSPRTPTPHDHSFPSYVHRPKSTPAADVYPVGFSPRSLHPDSVAMPPPPPPPPIVFAQDTPRVDYLLRALSRLRRLSGVGHLRTLHFSRTISLGIARPHVVSSPVLHRSCCRLPHLHPLCRRPALVRLHTSSDLHCSPCYPAADEV